MFITQYNNIEHLQSWEHYWQ